MWLTSISSNEINNKSAKSTPIAIVVGTLNTAGTVNKTTSFINARTINTINAVIDTTNHVSLLLSLNN